MQMTLREFIGELTGSGLLDDEQITRCLSELGMDAESGEADAFARGLVAGGTLTQFQADAAAQKRTAALVIGDYHVLDVAGAGGMGQVYKARHRILDRHVAIKVMHTAKTDNPKLVQRFYREARAVARLAHPNIVTAYDAGETAGGLYLAMEFVDGEDLSEIIKDRGPLTVDQAVNVTLQAARGLAYAHSHNLVHRDIKPANLLLARDGTVKILDLGLARFTEEADQGSEVSLTMAGRLMGTVEYMAPEHAANAKDADNRSDIYSLGCTMYRLLTGRLPYGGTTPVEKLIAQREEPIPLLSDSIEKIPEQLQGVFVRMVAKKPADRYQSMDDCISDLQAAAPEAENCDVSSLVSAEAAPPAVIDVNLSDAATTPDGEGVTAPDTLDASQPLQVAPESDPSRLKLSGNWNPPVREKTDDIPVAQKAELNKKLLIAAAAVIFIGAAIGLWAIFASGGSSTEPAPKPPQPTVKPPVKLPPAANEKWTTLPNGWRVGKAVNLGPTVNSPAYEGCPFVSVDGRTMLFHSDRDGGQGNSDLWMSFRTGIDAPWGRPVNMGSPVNAKGYDCSPSLTADGLTLVFQSDRAGGQGRDDLWLCTRRSRSDPWGQPVNLGPLVNTREPDYEPCLSADGLMLIFARVRGREKADLWMSSRPGADGPWGQPVNLGPSVNSKNTENGPSFTADGLTLVFHSDRPGGHGSFDLWMSTRAVGSKPFGEPVNLGPSVNSRTHDAGGCLSADGHMLYFHSDRPGGQGAADIWQVPLLPPGASQPPRATGGSVSSGGKAKVYTEWPFDSAEALRRRSETAKALGVDAAREIDLGKGVKMKLVLIPAGTFVMGSPSDEVGRIGKGGKVYQGNEGPQHRVWITKPFYMSVTEVTQAQYMVVTGNNPSKYKGANRPVEQVSWNDAVAFCKRLSAAKKRTFRLPTEAEWEYACRAGTQTRFSFGESDEDLGQYAWYKANSGGQTHPVGEKKPNPWGLRDMRCNVWEWCMDWYGDYTKAEAKDPVGPLSGSRRVLRGGSWYNHVYEYRSSYRHRLTPGTRNWNSTEGQISEYGFRVVVQVP